MRCSKASLATSAKSTVPLDTKGACLSDLVRCCSAAVSSVVFGTAYRHFPPTDLHERRLHSSTCIQVSKCVFRKQETQTVVQGRYLSASR